MQQVAAVAVVAGLGFLGYQWYIKCKVDNKDIDVILHKEEGRKIEGRKVLVQKDDTILLSYDSGTNKVTWNYKSISVNPDQTVIIEYICIAKNKSYRESLKIKSECIDNLPEYLGKLLGGSKIKVNDIHLPEYKNDLSFDIHLKYVVTSRNRKVEGTCEFKIEEFERLQGGLELIGEDQIADKMVDINSLCNYGTDVFRNCKHESVLTNAAFLRFCDDPTCESKIKKDKEDIKKIQKWKDGSGDGNYGSGYNEHIYEIKAICEVSKNLRQGSCEGDSLFDDYQSMYDELCSDCNTTLGMVEFAKSKIREINKRIADYIPTEGGISKEVFSEQQYVDNAGILQSYCQGVKYLKDKCGVDKTTEDDYKICPVDCYINKLHVKHGLKQNINFGFGINLDVEGLMVAGTVRQFCKSAEFLRDNCDDTSAIESDHYKEWCPAACYLARIHFDYYKRKLSSVVSVKDNILTKLKNFKDYTVDEIDYVEEMVANANAMKIHCKYDESYFKDDLIYQFFTPIECFRAMLVYSKERPKLFDGLIPKYDYTTFNSEVGAHLLSPNPHPDVELIPEGKYVNTDERQTILNFSAALRILNRKKDGNAICKEFAKEIKDDDFHYYPGECFIAAMDIQYYYYKLYEAEKIRLDSDPIHLDEPLDKLAKKSRLDIYIPIIYYYCDAVKKIQAAANTTQGNAMLSRQSKFTFDKVDTLDEHYCAQIKDWLVERGKYSYYCPAECFVAKLKIGIYYKALNDANVRFDMGEYTKSYEEFMGMRDKQGNKYPWKEGDPPIKGSDYYNVFELCRHYNNLIDPTIGCMDIKVPVYNEETSVFELFSYKNWLEQQYGAVYDDKPYNILDDYCPAECFVSRFKIKLAHDHLDKVKISFDMGEYTGSVEFDASKGGTGNISQGKGLFFERDVPIIEELCKEIKFLKENCNDRYKRWLIDERVRRYGPLIQNLNDAILSDPNSNSNIDFVDTPEEIIEYEKRGYIIERIKEKQMTVAAAENEWNLEKSTIYTDIDKAKTLTPTVVAILKNGGGDGGGDGNDEGRQIKNFYIATAKMQELDDNKFDIFCPAECFIAKVVIDLAYNVLRDRFVPEFAGEGDKLGSMSAYFGNAANGIKTFEKIDEPTIHYLCDQLAELKSKNCPPIYKVWLDQYGSKYDVYCPAECFIAKAKIVALYQDLQKAGISEEKMSEYFITNSLETFIEQGEPKIHKLCDEIDILKKRKSDIVCHSMYDVWMEQNIKYEAYCPAKCFIARHVIIQTDKIIQEKHEYTYVYNDANALELNILVPTIGICDYKSNVKDDNVMTLYEDLLLLQKKFEDLLITSNCPDRFVDEKIRGIVRKYYPIDAFMSVYIFKSVFKYIQDLNVTVMGEWLTKDEGQIADIKKSINCLCSAYKYLQIFSNYNNDIAGKEGKIIRDEKHFYLMINNDVVVAEQMCPADYFINLSYFNHTKKVVNYDDLTVLETKVKESGLGDPIDVNGEWYGIEQNMKKFCNYGKLALDAVDDDAYKVNDDGTPGGKFGEVKGYLDSHTFSGSGGSIYQAVCPAEGFTDYFKYVALQNDKVPKMYTGTTLNKEYVGLGVPEGASEQHQEFLDYIPKMCNYKDSASKIEKYKGELESTHIDWKKTCPTKCSLAFAQYKHLSGVEGQNDIYCKFTGILLGSQCKEFREREGSVFNEDLGEYNQRCLYPSNN